MELISGLRNNSFGWDLRQLQVEIGKMAVAVDNELEKQRLRRNVEVSGGRQDNDAAEVSKWESGVGYDSGRPQVS